MHPLHHPLPSIHHTPTNPAFLPSSQSPFPNLKPRPWRLYSLNPPLRILTHNPHCALNAAQSNRAAQRRRTQIPRPQRCARERLREDHETCARDAVQSEERICSRHYGELHCCDCCWGQSSALCDLGLWSGMGEGGGEEEEGGGEGELHGGGGGGIFAWWWEGGLGTSGLSLTIDPRLRIVKLRVWRRNAQRRLCSPPRRLAPRQSLLLCLCFVRRTLCDHEELDFADGVWMVSGEGWDSRGERKKEVR